MWFIQWLTFIGVYSRGYDIPQCLMHCKPDDPSSDSQTYMIKRKRFLQARSQSYDFHMCYIKPVSIHAYTDPHIHTETHRKKIHAKHG